VDQGDEARLIGHRRDRVQGSSPDWSDLAFCGDSASVSHEAAPFVGVGWWLSDPRSPYSTTKAAASSIFN